MWLAMGTILQGWACAMQGRQVEGIEHIRRGIYAWRATGAENVLPYFFVLLADACGEAGQAEAGRKVLAEALGIINTTGERWWEAELYRLQGEFLLMHAPPDEREAERCFCQALAVSRHQGAQLWELRAATSLGRLWLRHGKGEATQQLLAEVYGKFSEGCDTVDLQKTQALLDELANG
jgi:predicted ATPase